MNDSLPAEVALPVGLLAMKIERMHILIAGLALSSAVWAHSRKGDDPTERCESLVKRGMYGHAIDAGKHAVHLKPYDGDAQACLTVAYLRHERMLAAPKAKQ